MEDIKKKVFDKMNERMGRDLPETIHARQGSMIIGVVFNLPKADKYEIDCFTTNGITRRYESKHELTIVDFSKLYSYGMSYGIVMSVGEGVFNIKRGDKVMLRTMPTDTIIYDGMIYHVIREVDICGIVDKDNEDIENYNK